MIARTRFGNTWYLHVYDGWVSAPALSDPWTLANRRSRRARRRLADAGQVERSTLLTGNHATPKPTLGSGVPPSTSPQFRPSWLCSRASPICCRSPAPRCSGHEHASDVIVDTSDNLLRADGSGAGSARRDSTVRGPSSRAMRCRRRSCRFRPRARRPSVVLASVAGTPQAQEAVIANSIPQTASVLASTARPSRRCSTARRQWRVDHWHLAAYVANSPTPVIGSARVSFMR